MKIIKAISLALLILQADSVAAAAVAHRHDVPVLEGAEPAAKSSEYYNLHSFGHPNDGGVRVSAHDQASPAMTRLDASSADAASSEPGYTYSLRINATLPLALDWETGQPIMDRCVEWMADANGSNFTWYGLRILLDDDASINSGGYYTDVTRATPEQGWVQDYNATPPATILEYNITTHEAQPTIRLNVNDNPFWETYRFDFIDAESSDDGEGSDYQQFVKEMRGAISCYATPASESSRTILAPVVPTLTISLQRFGGNVDPATPSPTPPSSSTAVPRGSIVDLCVVIASAVLMQAFL